MVILSGAVLPGCVTAAKYMKLQDELASAEEERDYALDNLGKAEAMLSELQGDQAALADAQSRVMQLEAEKEALAAQYEEFRGKHALLLDQGIETVMLPEEGMIGYRAKGDVLFASGSDTLTEEGKSILATIARELKQTALPIRVDGHTDIDPVKKSRERFPAGNIELGAKRAIAVSTYLVTQGIADERISVQSFGPFKPVAMGTDDAAKSRNRRVEILLRMPTAAQG